MSIPIIGRREPRGAPAPGQGIVVLVYDTFTDADGTQIQSHTPETDVVGGGWISKVRSDGSSSTGSLIQSNMLENGVPDNTFIDTGSNEIRMRVDAEVGTHKNAGFVLWHNNVDNNWVIRNKDGTLEIWSGVGDSWTLHATTAGAATSYPQQEVLTVIGNEITFESGGKSVTFTPTSPNKATRHGLHHWYFADTLTIEDLS